MISFRSKFTGIAALAVATMSLTACFGTDSEETATGTVKVSSFHLDSAAVTIGSTAGTPIRGNIESSTGGLVIAYTVLDKQGADVSEDFTITSTAPGASVTSWSLGTADKGNTSIKANSILTVQDTGAYSIKIVVKNSAGAKDSAQVGFTLKAAGNTTVGTALKVTADGLAAGGAKAAAGSFISVKNDTVYNQTQSMTMYNAIDLYVTTNAAGQAVFKSTAAAVKAYDDGDSVGTLTGSYWGFGRATVITQVQSAATTLEQAKAAIASLTTETQVTTVNTTDAVSYYVVKTAENVYALLWVDSVSGAGANITFKLKILK